MEDGRRATGDGRPKNSPIEIRIPCQKMLPYVLERMLSWVVQFPEYANYRIPGNGGVVSHTEKTDR